MFRVFSDNLFHTTNFQYFLIMNSSEKPPVKGKTTPYGFFVKMCYEEHKKKYPDECVRVTEISKRCSEKWKVN